MSENLADSPVPAQTRKGCGCLKLALILIIVLAGLLHFITPGIVRSAANKALPELLGTEASLDGVTLNLSSGRFGIRGLTIAQPEGFEGDPLLELGSFQVRIPLLQAAGQNPVVVNKVHLDGLTLRLQQAEEDLINVAQLGPQEEPAAAGEPVETAEMDPPPPIWVKHILLENISLVFQDLAKEWGLELQDVRLEIRDLAIMEPKGPKGPATITAQVDLIGPRDTARLRVQGRLGNIRPDLPDTAPPMQLAVGLIGFDLESIRPFLVRGVRTALGWGATDFVLFMEVGAGSTPEEQTIFGSYAMTTDSGQSYAQELGGTIASPELPFLNIFGELLGNQFGRVTRLGGNVAEGGVEAARAAVDTGAAAVRGAADTVTGAAGGLLRTARGVATLNREEAVGGLRDTTVGTVENVVGTVADTAGTAAGGVGAVTGTALGRDEIELWWEALDERVAAFETAAEAFFAERPFPSSN